MRLISFLIFWKVIVAVKSDKATKDIKYETDIGLSVVELIRKYEYPVEVYKNVKTEDDYLLEVYRIPHGKTNNQNESRIPILLMHGLMGSSRDFIGMGPEKGLAYLLAERGYDVWLGNARGTTYSRKHLHLNPNAGSKFWMFSMHEIGIYDLPAILALIRKTTKKEELVYLGHSQGTSVFYILASSRPEFNKNITVMISFAPVAYMKHMYSPLLRMTALFEPMLTWLSKFTGITEILPTAMQQMLGVINRIFCANKGIFQEICGIGFHITGGISPQMTQGVIPVMIHNGLAGASSFQALQYAQNINSGDFKPFDWGTKMNLQRYGSAKPRSYNISNIVTPVALYYSDNDWLSGSEDAVRLCSELPNCIYKFKVPNKVFNHYDFVMANDVMELLYNNVFELLDKYKK